MFILKILNSCFYGSLGFWFYLRVLLEYVIFIIMNRLLIVVKEYIMLKLIYDIKVDV